MVLVLYTLHALSPTLIWHCNLLAQLLAQFHADKQRTLAFKQLSYMQAIHETGARLTHDVKNLLQSLNAYARPVPRRAPCRRRLIRPCCGASCRRSANAWRKPFQNSVHHRIFQPCVQSLPRTGGGNSGKDWRH
jgi:hypothetical protein